MKHQRTLAAGLAFVALATLSWPAAARAREPVSREGYIPVTGGRVWYRVVGDAPATPLLVLHGGPGFPSYYLKPLAQLADERPVVFYDQLGAGHSDRPTDASLWRISRFVEELQAVRDTLGLKEVYLFGHSWGASLAVDYLLTKPKGVRGVILASPVLSVPAWQRDADSLLATLPDSVRSGLRRHESAGTTGTDDYHRLMIEYYKRYVTRLDPLPADVDSSIMQTGTDVYATMWGPGEFRATGSLRSYDRTGELSQIHLPVLFTAGRYDQAVPSTVRSFQRLMPGSRLEVFDGSSHMAMQEETGRYVKAVRAFLREADRNPPGATK
jgi:proline-specific peptidase